MASAKGITGLVGAIKGIRKKPQAAAGFTDVPAPAATSRALTAEQRQALAQMEQASGFRPTSTTAPTPSAAQVEQVAQEIAKTRRFVPQTRKGKAAAAAGLITAPTVGLPLAIMGGKGLLGTGASLWKSALGIGPEEETTTTAPAPSFADQLTQIQQTMGVFNQAEADRLRQLYAQPESLLQLAGYLSGTGTGGAGTGGTGGGADPYAAAAREAGAAQGIIGTPGGALTPAGPVTSGQVEDLRRAGKVYQDRLAYIERAASAAGVKVDDALRKQIFQSVLADESNRRNEVEAQIAARDIQTNDLIRQLALENLVREQAIDSQARAMVQAAGGEGDLEQIKATLRAQQTTKG